MTLWKAFVVAAISTAIATTPHFPSNVSIINPAIAQAKQPSSQPLRRLSGHNGIVRSQ